MQLLQVLEMILEYLRQQAVEEKTTSAHDDFLTQQAHRSRCQLLSVTVEADLGEPQAAVGDENR